MNERSTLVLGAIIGAAVGVGVGYLLFTEKGRRLREDMQPEIDTLVREAMRLGDAVQDARRGASASAGARPLTWPRRTT
jgi:gas vesicle protein